jgi:hypothetical protein
MARQNARVKPGILWVRDIAQAEELADQVRSSAVKLHAWIASFNGDGIGLMRSLKFDQIGIHPIDAHPLNAIEQVNQVWTYLAALSAVRVLFELHPNAGSFTVAPGAHAAQPLDVMSEVPGLVGAETFAAVDPRNNRKLLKDLDKLTGRAELHRYVFFSSPKFPGTNRLPQLERGGVQIWSVDA